MFKQLFYSLYDEYVKFYDSSLNINFEQSDAVSDQVVTNRIDKGY